MSKERERERGPSILNYRHQHIGIVYSRALLNDHLNIWHYIKKMFHFIWAIIVPINLNGFHHFKMCTSISRIICSVCIDVGICIRISLAHSIHNNNNNNSKMWQWRMSHLLLSLYLVIHCLHWSGHSADTIWWYSQSDLESKNKCNSFFHHNLIEIQERY